jgi:hypothetical protein
MSYLYKHIFYEIYVTQKIHGNPLKCLSIQKISLKMQSLN